MQLQIAIIFLFLDWILNDGQILNWNGEWVRRGDRNFDHQLNPFKSEGGSLPKTASVLAYQVTSRYAEQCTLLVLIDFCPV